MAQSQQKPVWSYNQQSPSYYQQSVNYLPYNPIHCSDACCQPLRCPEPRRPYQSQYPQHEPVQNHHPSSKYMPVNPYWPQTSCPPPQYSHPGVIRRPQPHNRIDPNEFVNLPRYRFQPYPNSVPTVKPNYAPAESSKRQKRVQDLDVRQFLATWQDKDEECPEPSESCPPQDIEHCQRKDMYQPLDFTLRQEVPNGPDSYSESALQNLENYSLSKAPFHKPYAHRVKPEYHPNYNVHYLKESYQVPFKPPNPDFRNKEDMYVPNYEDRIKIYENESLTTTQIDKNVKSIQSNSWLSVACERRIERISNPSLNYLMSPKATDITLLDTFTRKECVVGDERCLQQEVIGPTYEVLKPVSDKYHLTACLETDELFDDINKKKDERQKLVVHPLRHEYNQTRKVDVPHLSVKPTLLEDNGNVTILEGTDNGRTSTTEPHWCNPQVDQQLVFNNRSNDCVSNNSSYLLDLTSDTIPDYNLCKKSPFEQPFPINGNKILNDKMNYNVNAGLNERERLERYIENSKSSSNPVPCFSQYSESPPLQVDNEPPCKKLCTDDISVNKHPEEAPSAVSRPTTDEICLSSDDIDISISSAELSISNIALHPPISDEILGMKACLSSDNKDKCENNSKLFKEVASIEPDKLFAESPVTEKIHENLTRLAPLDNGSANILESNFDQACVSDEANLVKESSDEPNRKETPEENKEETLTHVTDDSNNNICEKQSQNYIADSDKTRNVSPFEGFDNGFSHEDENESILPIPVPKKISVLPSKPELNSSGFSESSGGSPQGFWGSSHDLNDEPTDLLQKQPDHSDIVKNDIYSEVKGDCDLENFKEVPSESYTAFLKQSAAYNILKKYKKLRRTKRKYKLNQSYENDRSDKSSLPNEHDSTPCFMGEKLEVGDNLVLILNGIFGDDTEGNENKPIARNECNNNSEREKGEGTRPSSEKCNHLNEDINENILQDVNNWPYLEEEVEAVPERVNLKCSLRWDRIFNVRDKKLKDTEKSDTKLDLGPAKVELHLGPDKGPGQWRIINRCKNKHSQVVEVKRLIMQRKSSPEERVPKMIIKKTEGQEYKSFIKETQLQPTVILERCTEIDKMAKEELENPSTNCSACCVALDLKEEGDQHKCHRKEVHHCVLCQQSFSSTACLQVHQESKGHRHLVLVERSAVHRVHRILTGRDCPHIPPLSPSDLGHLSWLPDYPGYSHFYHNMPFPNS